jgi:hypothetical protein
MVKVLALYTMKKSCNLSHHYVSIGCMRLLAFVLLSCGITGSLYGQTPVESPAFDKNCYQPRIGIEIDTLYGDTAGQNLGIFFMQMPPREGENYGDVIFGGERDNISYLTAVKTGPDFNLHNLQIRQKMNFKAVSAKFGHFHDRHHMDMLVDDYIFWADDSGFYDSSRKTRLDFCVTYPPYEASISLKSYKTYLTSDTVEDIVLGFIKYHYTDSNGVDSAHYYLTLYKGGSKLFNAGSVACEDSSAYVFESDTYFEVSQGDFRGSGRQDLIAISLSSHDYFYYKNDETKPFALSNIAEALRNDTLGNGINGSAFPMKVLPKGPADSSQDILIGINTNKFTTQAVYVFRGGKISGQKD